MEMNLQEEYFSDKDGNIDTNKLFYKTTEPKFMPGNRSAIFTAPVFWYSKEPSTNLFDPVAVSTTEKDTVNGKGILLKAELINAADLQKDFVLQFFDANEDFCRNIFGLKSRGLNPTEKNINIHLLVVANTNDSTIGASCYKDMQRTVHTFQDLAEFLGIKIYPTTIYGKLYNKKNIENAIKDLKPTADDIVIFYYSGHGFRKAGNNRRYPFLDFRAKPKDNYNVYSMNIEDIFQLIAKKPSRFNLVLSDCCNNLPGSTNAIGTAMPEPRGSGLEWDEDNIRALFLNPKRMSVLATAADVGQRASSNNSFGGFFSYFMKTSMEDHFSAFKDNVNWDQVLKEAHKQTVYKAEHTYCDKPYVPENVCKQHPFYKIVYDEE
jgi:hypothetical protein